jgi:asparagine synthase (glutamine-hydrolysing)
LHGWELVTGLPIGAESAPIAPLADHHDPRGALEAAIASALTRSPCVVSFSGGRDSSAVLASATSVARREGLPDPVPMTLRFAGIVSIDESSWQERVIAHLGLGDWERIEIDEELDYLGDIAQAGLRAHGLLYPANAHLHVPIFERARGGRVLTGFDGDGLFGSWRWARAQGVLHGRIRPQPRDPVRIALAFAPRALRRRVMREPLLAQLPWVRAQARPALASLLLTEAAGEPRRWDERVHHYARRRHLHLTTYSLQVLADRHDVEVMHPLLDGAFLAAVSRAGGAAGLGDRTSAMEALFGDLLPRETITRRTKAEFSGGLWRTQAKAFAARWEGTGLDERIDPQRLREEWRSPTPWFGANTLLQAAWLSGV